MRSKVHEPHAMRGQRGQTLPVKSLWVWWCSVCRSPFGAVPGHIPYACPSCGVGFTVLRCGDLFMSSQEAGSLIRQYGDLVPDCPAPAKLPPRL